MMAIMRSLVLAMLWSTGTASLCDLADDPSLRRDTTLQVSPIASFTGLGYSMCERICSNVSGSLSFNYFRPEGKCECLGESSATSPQALVSREGWHHGDIDSVDSTNGSNCECADGIPCNLDLPALVHCPLNCPAPPQLTNAQVHRTEDAAAFYTCHEDFGFIGSSHRVTCTEGVTWSGLNGSCVQVSWYNVTLSEGVGPLPPGWIQPIPGPVSPGWKVEVVGMPTQPNRSGIGLMSGADIHALFDMRFHGGTTWNYTAIVRYIAGRWLNEERVLDAPWEVGKTFSVTIAINPADTEFEINVDDDPYTNYSCFGSCGPLTDVLVFGDMLAYSVRMAFPYP